LARPVVEQVSSLDGLTTEGFFDATGNHGACAGIRDAGFVEAENGIESPQNPVGHHERNQRAVGVCGLRKNFDVQSAVCRSISRFMCVAESMLTTSPTIARERLKLGPVLNPVGISS
tara:strand:- start:20 stop:370 length:351 start_codon:yes stop_codon:yes gene_type:complete